MNIKKISFIGFVMVLSVGFFLHGDGDKDEETSGHLISQKDNGVQPLKIKKDLSLNLPSDIPRHKHEEGDAPATYESVISQYDSSLSEKGERLLAEKTEKFMQELEERHKPLKSDFLEKGLTANMDELQMGHAKYASDNIDMAVEAAESDEQDPSYVLTVEQKLAQELGRQVSMDEVKAYIRKEDEKIQGLNAHLAFEKDALAKLYEEGKVAEAEKMVSKLAREQNGAGDVAGHEKSEEDFSKAEKSEILRRMMVTNLNLEAESIQN